MTIDEEAKEKAIIQAEDIRRDEGGRFIDIFVECYEGIKEAKKRGNAASPANTALVQKLVDAIPAARKAVKMQCYIDEYPEPTGRAKTAFYRDMNIAERIVDEALTEANAWLKQQEARGG